MSGIVLWLTSLGLEKYIPAFAEAEIEFSDLPSLTDEDLKEVGLPVGPRRRVNEAIKSLDNGSESTLPEVNISASRQTNPDVVYPSSSSDAERSVRAGLSIIDAVRKTNLPDGLPLSTRVGIATGVVIVGDLIGSGATQEAAVVGETPNLAARLQGIAGLNQLIIARETQRLLGTIFDLALLDGQNLKGISSPVDAYQVEGEATVQSRFAARQSGAMTPIVGRQREIELMSER